jgi:hypothetical protein
MVIYNGRWRLDNMLVLSQNSRRGKATYRQLARIAAARIYLRRVRGYMFGYRVGEKTCDLRQKGIACWLALSPKKVSFRGDFLFINMKRLIYKKFFILK